jgi:hypothetical protein
VRQAHVHHGDVPREQLARAVEGEHLLQRLDRAHGRQQNALVAVEHHVPAPLAHPQEPAQPVLHRLGRREKPQRLGHRGIGAAARDQRQVRPVGPRGERAHAPALRV